MMAITILKSPSSNLDLLTKGEVMAKYASTFNASIAVVPVILIGISKVTSRGMVTTPAAEKRWIVTVCLSSCLLSFRAAWLKTVYLMEPLAWWLSKSVFYIVIILPEFPVVFIYLLLRVDKFFYPSPYNTIEGPYYSSSRKSSKSSLLHYSQKSSTRTEFDGAAPPCTTNIWKQGRYGSQFN